MPRSHRRKSIIKLQEKTDLKPNRISKPTTDLDSSKNQGNLLIETLDDSPQINIIILPQVIYKEEVKPIASTVKEIKSIKNTNYLPENFKKIKFKENSLDCSLKKWVWACQNFKNWNELVF